MLSLKLARVKKGWTQEQLSEKSGVGRITISKIEREGVQSVRVGILEKIAAALDSSIKDLFFSNNEE